MQHDAVQCPIAVLVWWGSLSALNIAVIPWYCMRTSGKVCVIMRNHCSVWSRYILQNPFPRLTEATMTKFFIKFYFFLNDGFPKAFELWGYRNWDTCLNTLNMNNSSITTTLKLQLNLISWQSLCLNLAKYNCITGWGSGLSLWMTGLSLLGHLIQPRSAHPRPCQRRAAAALMHLRINLTLPAASRRRCFLSLTNLGLIYEAAFS